MSDRALRILIVAFSLIGITISAYLTYIHYKGIAPICTIGGDCETVQKSSYAELVGVPVAAYGLVGDIAILATALFTTRLARFAGFFLSLTGFLFSIYLTYLELFVVHAICQWCVAHAVVITLLLALTSMRFLRDY